MKNPNIDEGLRLAKLNQKPSECMTLERIAHYCKCKKQSIWQIERRALRKLRNKLKNYA